MVGPSHELNVPHFSPHPFWGRPTDYNILEHNFGVDREGHGPGKRNLKLLRVHYSSTCTCERPTICGLVLRSISFFSLASITPTNPNSEVAAREAFSHPLRLFLLYFSIIQVNRRNESQRFCHLVYTSRLLFLLPTLFFTCCPQLKEHLGGLLRLFLSLSESQIDRVRIGESFYNTHP